MNLRLLMSIWNRYSFFVWVCCFEGGLALVGWTLGRVTDTAVTSQIVGGLRGVLQGLAATVPMLGLLWWLQISKREAIAEIREMVSGKLLLMFRGWKVWQFALLSLAAGVGEEILFRGWMQQWLSGSQGVVFALVVSSAVFAFVHLITPAYGWITFGVSIYLGLLLIVTGDLVAPMVAHGVYDFIALTVLMRKTRAR